MNSLLKLLSVLVCCMAGTSIASERPNIVLVLADDLGYHSLGVLGQEKIKTPNLDNLARNGMIFTRFYGTHLCSPTRGSLATGMHTGNGLIRGNYELGGYEDSEEFGQMPLPLNLRTLGTELKRAGYATGVMGKWGIGGPGSTGAPNLHGIDEFFGYLDQKQAHNYYPTHLWRNETLVPLANRSFSVHPSGIDISDPNDSKAYLPYKGEIYSADVIHKEAMKFIERNRERPFFLEMAYTLPHMALQVPERALRQYQGKFDDTPYLGKQGYIPCQYPRATYAAMISLLDEYVGDLLRVLREHNIEKNTLVIFTADNGAAVVGGCEADYFNTSGDLRGRKGSLYEGGIRVPFIASWPGVIKPGTASEHLSAIWDLMPTFLELAGTPEMTGLDGISFAPTLKGEPGQQDHKFLYWERHSKTGDSHTQAVRMGDWKAVKSTRGDQTETALFNLKSDPSEKQDVSAAHPKILSRAQTCMKERRLAVIAEWNFAKPGTEE
jgi:arylsulfatase A-like enzyme